MGFMKWQAEFGSDYLKISAYITFGMFVIFGIIAFIVAFIPMKSSCIDDSDCSGEDNKCKDQFCDKKRHLYWLIGVAIGSVIFGFCMFWLMTQASHSKTLSQIAAFGAEANMVSDLMNPNRFNSSKRRTKTKR
jgi:uncharacterized BrkB/YihY/UPF0761 family membrane protein